MIPIQGNYDPGPYWDVPCDDRSERWLWAAVLEQAIDDAHSPSGCVTRAEQADARAFLADLQRLGPICEVLGIDPEWMQKQLIT